MKNFLKEQKKVLISLIIGIILILIWLKFVDIEQMWQYLKNVNLFWVLISSIFYLLAYFIRSLRWKVILNPVVKTSVKEIFTLFMSGMLINYIVPIRVGELAKGYFLKKNRDIPMAQSLPTIFFDKMMDLMPVLLLFILIPFIGGDINQIMLKILNIVLVIFIIFVVIIIFCLVKKEYASAILKFFFIWLPKKIKTQVNSFIEKFVDGMKVIKNHKIIFLAVVLTIVAILFDTLYMVTMFKAFNYNIALLIALFGYTLINLSYILPTPPAQIGSNEAIFIVIFTFAFGIDKNLVSATLGFAHLITATLIFLVGIISLNTLSLSFKQVFSLNYKDSK
ncbi:MAG: hypothetical protein ACD_58C00146G0006 [uncultured bacterium]|nr:MAG: hypothetical protein ACD_58C00146G0006 [uncultured bacterium]